MRAGHVFLDVFNAGCVQLFHPVLDAGEGTGFRGESACPAEIFFACANQQLSVAGNLAERIQVLVLQGAAAQNGKVSEASGFIHVQIRGRYTAHRQAHHGAVLSIAGYVVMRLYKRDDVFHHVLADGGHIPVVVRRIVHGDDNGRFDDVVCDRIIEYVLYAALVHPLGFLAAAAVGHVQRLVCCAVCVISCGEVNAQIAGVAVDVRVGDKGYRALGRAVVLVVVTAVADNDHALALNMIAGRIADRGVRRIIAQIIRGNRVSLSVRKNGIAGGYGFRSAERKGWVDSIAVEIRGSRQLERYAVQSVADRGHFLCIGRLLERRGAIQIAAVGIVFWNNHAIDGLVGFKRIQSPIFHLGGFIGIFMRTGPVGDIGRIPGKAAVQINILGEFGRGVESKTINIHGERHIIQAVLIGLLGYCDTGFILRFRLCIVFRMRIDCPCNASEQRGCCDHAG